MGFGSLITDTKTGAALKVTTETWLVGDLVVEVPVV